MKQRAPLSDLFKGSKAGIITQLFSIAGGLALTVCVARVQSNENAAVFFLAFSYTAFASLVAAGGFRNAVTRLLVSLESEGKELGLIGGVRLLLLGVLFAIVPSLASGFAAYFLLLPDVSLSIWTALSSLFMSLQMLSSESFRAKRKFFIYGLVNGGANQLCLFLYFICLQGVGVDVGPSQLLGGLAFTSMVFFIVSIYYFIRTTSEKSAAISLRTAFLRDALPLTGISMLTFLISRMDLWLVDWFLPPSAVVGYAVAQRVVSLIGPLHTAIGNVLLPISVAASAKKQDVQAVARMASAALTSVTAMIAVLLVLTSVFSKEVGLGQILHQGELVVIVLVVAQVVGSYFGCSIIICSVYRRYNVQVFALFIALLIMVIVSCLLRSVGGVGIALASLVAGLFYRVLLWFYCGRNLGVWTAPSIASFCSLMNKASRLVLKRGSSASYSRSGS